MPRAGAKVRRHSVLVAVAGLVSLYYIGTHYAGWFYRGGPLLNHGLFTRPRYEANFPSMPMNVAGSYEYTFSHFPVSDDDSAIMLVPESAQTSESLASLSTQVRLSVVDQYGQHQCDATGAPTWKGREQLVITGTGDRVLALYHLKCLRLRLQACAPCRLTITIGPVDPSTPRIRIIPTIQGGGLELL